MKEPTNDRLPHDRPAAVERPRKPAVRRGQRDAEPSAEKPVAKTAPRAGRASQAAPLASLATLSAHLGLSRAAISRVLNRAPAARSIPQATQDRIFAAAQLLNYRPNAAARSLRHGRSHLVGVMVPELSEGYATLVLSGIEQELLAAGYVFLLVSHHHREETIERAQAHLLDRSVEGIIAVDTPVHAALTVPTITVSCPLDSPGVMNIVLNHRVAGTLAIEHLHGLGHRHIAVIKGQSFSSDTRPRWLALQRAAEVAGTPIDLRLVTALKGDAPTHEPGYFATQRLLAEGLPFTALIAFNDVSAIGAVRALREAGLRVPEDVSVVGFDDVQSAAFQNPALTTVRQPLRTMGMLAAESLLQQIASGDRSARQLTVDPELIVRESTGRAAAKTR